MTLVDAFKVQPIQNDNHYSLLNNPCGVTTTRIRRERPLPSVSFLLQLTVTLYRVQTWTDDFVSFLIHFQKQIFKN